MRAVLVGIALAGLGGCEESPGLLSPETVNALSKTAGDAEGFDRSGLYTVLVDTVDCPCDEMVENTMVPMAEGLVAFSLCAQVDQFPNSDRIDARVVATDGVVTLEVAGSDAGAMVGPLYDDGEFSTGAVTRITSLAATGSLITRVDGEFTLDNDRHEFEATLLNRIVGSTVLDTSSLSVDCTEELEVLGSFAQPI